MKDYVSIQHEAPTTLDIKVRHIILCIKDVLRNGTLLLKGKMGNFVEIVLRTTLVVISHWGDLAFQIGSSAKRSFMFCLQWEKCEPSCCMIHANEVGIRHIQLHLWLYCLHVIGLSSMLEIFGISYIFGQMVMVSKRQTRYYHGDNIIFLVDKTLDNLTMRLWEELTIKKLLKATKNWAHKVMITWLSLILTQRQGYVHQSTQSLILCTNWFSAFASKMLQQNKFFTPFLNEYQLTQQIYHLLSKTSIIIIWSWSSYVHIIQKTPSSAPVPT